jgi:4-hydroxy-2-oxoheptanedioate aldolase
MTLKQRLADGNVLHGSWCGLDHPSVVQILGQAGFDFISLDMQHSFNTFGSLTTMIDALDKTGVASMVRVPWNTPDYVMRALDLGAEAVIVPMVNNAEEAKRAADACRYAPAGTRSWGPIWSVSRGRLVEHDEGDARSICVVMIETAAGLENLDEILAVEGVGAVYIGPNDLSLSLGLGRKHYTESEKLRETIISIVKRCNAAGVVVGIDCSGAEQAHYWRDQGCNFTISASDAGLLFKAASDAARALRGEAATDGAQEADIAAI